MRWLPLESRENGATAAGMEGNRGEPGVGGPTIRLRAASETPLLHNLPLCMLYIIVARGTLCASLLARRFKVFREQREGLDARGNSTWARAPDEHPAPVEIRSRSTSLESLPGLLERRGGAAGGQGRGGRPAGGTLNEDLHQPLLSFVVSLKSKSVCH